MAKKLNQQDLLKLTSIGTPPTDSVAFAAKSDGLYQKVGTTESKLSTTAELLDRVKTPVPANAKFTDTNTVYTHPTTAGYKHIPTGGATNQILRYSADGTAVWSAEKNTTYGAVTTSANGLMIAADKVKLNGIEEGANKYSHPTGAGNNHIPSGGAAGQFLKWSSSGVAVWAADNNTTYSTGTLVQLKAGTDTTGRLQTAKDLNDWLNDKGYITSYVNTTYTAGTNVQISGTNVISATDTKYSLPTATGTTLGGVKIGSNISITSGVISVAAPYSHPSTHPISMISGLQTALDGKSASTHTHSNITITAGTGLSGGGALSVNRTLSIASTYAPNTSTSLGASKNLNDYRTAGFYHQTSNANATTALNYPVASAGALLVETAAGVIQTYKVYSSSDVYVRGYYDTTWTVWRKLVNTSDSIPWARITGTPATATTHPTWAQVTGKPTTFTPSSHSHGNITNDGKIGTAANRVIETTTGGLLRAKSAGTTSQYLRGDGSWATPPNTTYVVATTSANGLMSSDDKTKLNGIAAGANKTTLSASVTSTSATNAATSSAVKSAYDRGSTGIADAATAQAKADSAYSLASGKENSFTKNDAFNKDFGTAAGTVAQGNDSRINNGQTAYGWGNHASAGYIKSYVDTTYTAGTNVQISGTNVISATDTKYVVATTSANGLMSSDDKTKLNGIAAGANKTTLSSSTSSTSATTAATSSAVKSAYDRGSLGVTNAATAQARADSAYTLANGKEGKFTKNDAFNKDFGTAAGTVAQGNDSRINNGQTAYGWGNHASAGYIKSYVNTTYTALSGGGLTLSTGNAFSVKFGTTLGTACAGNDSRLSNARPPTTHTHAWSQITSRPTKLSEFTFDLTSWSGNLTITGTLTANALFKSSDVRLKELIQPINTSNIDNIDLIEFNWKSDNKKDYGVKAQDVEAYYPELINTDDTGMKSVNYESLYAIKIARLEERIKELEDKLCQKN